MPELTERQREVTDFLTSDTEHFTTALDLCNFIREHCSSLCMDSRDDRATLSVRVTRWLESIDKLK